VIKFVSDLRQAGDFLWILQFLSTNKTDCHDITEILLKVVLSAIAHNPNHMSMYASTHFLPTRFIVCSLEVTLPSIINKNLNNWQDNLKHILSLFSECEG
jgi:hypothetical protein